METDLAEELITSIRELTGEIRRLAELIEDALPDDAPIEDSADTD